jgi:ubiquinol-cytochrome c reductase cytochrome c subunit
LRNFVIARGSLRFLAGAALAAMMLASTAGTAAAQGQKSDQDSQGALASLKGNAENGKKLFMKDGCFECHGTVGQGSTSTGGARIGPPAISFEAMVQYVHHPSGQMPPYTSKVISDQDLTDIYAYLKAQPAATPAKNIPLLNQ